MGEKSYTQETLDPFLYGQDYQEMVPFIHFHGIFLGEDQPAMLSGSEDSFEQQMIDIDRVQHSPPP